MFLEGKCRFRGRRCPKLQDGRTLSDDIFFNTASTRHLYNFEYQCFTTSEEYLEIFFQKWAVEKEKSVFLPSKKIANIKL